MPDEHNPVICPWCGKQILESNWEARFTVYPGGFSYTSCRFRCECGVCTPWGDYQPDKKRGLESAYADATRRPPNKPLTLAELFDLDPETDAVWLVNDAFTAYDVIVMSAEAACEWASDANSVFFFARKPTHADIEAARKERHE